MDARGEVDSLVAARATLGARYTSADRDCLEALQVYFRFHGAERELGEEEHVGMQRNEYTGDLPAYTSIGCYPLFYFQKDESVLCTTCANASGGIYGGDVNWESEIWCDECSDPVESAYGVSE